MFGVLLLLRDLLPPCVFAALMEVTGEMPPMLQPSPWEWGGVDLLGDLDFLPLLPRSREEMSGHFLDPTVGKRHHVWTCIHFHCELSSRRMEGTGSREAGVGWARPPLPEFMSPLGNHSERGSLGSPSLAWNSPTGPAVLLFTNKQEDAHCAQG